MHVVVSASSEEFPIYVNESEIVQFGEMAMKTTLYC